MKLNIGKKNNSVRNNDIESQKNLACFETYTTDVIGELHCLQGCLRKQTGREDSFNAFLCVAHTVFTSKYYIIQWISTNGNST